MPHREVLTIHWDGEVLLVGGQRMLYARRDMACKIIDYLIKAPGNRVRLSDLAVALYGPRLSLDNARTRTCNVIVRARGALKERFGNHLDWFHRKDGCVELIGGCTLNVRIFEGWRRPDEGSTGTDQTGYQAKSGATGS